MDNLIPIGTDLLRTNLTVFKYIQRIIELDNNPMLCPKCKCDLVHDENNVFNRCLGCGWYQKRIT